MDKININDSSMEELNYYIKTLTSRKKLLNLLGGCPPEELRVDGKTNCFYCDECWIATLEKVLTTKSIKE